MDARARVTRMPSTGGSHYSSSTRTGRGSTNNTCAFPVLKPTYLSLSGALPAPRFRACSLAVVCSAPLAPYPQSSGLSAPQALFTRYMPRTCCGAPRTQGANIAAQLVDQRGSNSADALAGLVASPQARLLAPLAPPMPGSPTTRALQRRLAPTRRGSWRMRWTTSPCRGARSWGSL